MRYALEQYDKHGFLKAPQLAWLGWLLLAKAWVVFVVAGASRESGSRILSFVYPDNHLFYLDLAMGIPSIALMWLVSLRNPERHWVNRIVAYGRSITVTTAFIQLLQTLYYVYLSGGVFSWAHGGIMLMLLWLIIYFVNSHTIKDSFDSIPIPINDTNQDK